MDITKLSEPLSPVDIELRVQSVNKGGYATILPYKDARVDMNRLDSVVGSLNWKREHFLIHNTMYCRVSIFSDKLGDWVSKEDCGTQSMTEKEKGLSSDAFKRACFNWGIGRELYSYPLISVKLIGDEVDRQTGKVNTYNFPLKTWKITVAFNSASKQVSFLSLTDQNNIVRFSWGLPLIPKEAIQKAAESIKNGAYTIAQIETKYSLTESVKAEILKLSKA